MITDRERGFAKALREMGGNERSVAGAIAFSRFMRALDESRVVGGTLHVGPLFYAYARGQVTPLEVCERTGGLPK